MGFTVPFYSIFGTNLLTKGPVQIAIFFCLFQCFAQKEYQTESKQNETFGNVIFRTNMIQRTWSLRKAINEEGTRQGARPPPPGAPSTVMGPSLLHRHSSSSYIYPCTLETSYTEPKPYFHHRNLLYREIPSWGLFRRPAGGGIDHGGLLHQHHSLSDDV